MSIASEIQRIQDAKDDIKSAIENKGVTVPSATKLDGYSELIDSIKPNIVPYAIRPDAELVKTWSYDTRIVEDEEVTIPAYTTTARTLKSAWDLSPTYTINYNTYDYFIVEYFLTIPEYNTTTVAKGRQEYTTAVYVYELAELPGSTLHALVNPDKFITARTARISGASTTNLVYYSGSSTLSAAGLSYGAYQTGQTPSLSSGVFTMKSPNLNIRGSSSHFTEDYWNALTDIRYQGLIELYRAPKNGLNRGGWTAEQATYRILDCIDNNNRDLA